MKNTILRLLFLLYALFLASSCSTTSRGNAVLQEYPFAENNAEAQHLVFIGLDGWGSAYVKKADMPTVKRMILGGASSLDVLCVMPSISWPNWSSLFFGAAPQQRTGHTEPNAPENIVDNFPSVFSLVKNSNPGKAQSVFFYEWSELYKICSSETAETLEIESNLESTQKIAAYIVEKKPAFTAIVFNQPDSTGHSKRWGSAVYYAKLAELDSYIAIIEQAVKDAGIYESAVFILSADHGGTFWGHGYNIPKQRKIPLIIYGPGIKNGFLIPSPLSICDIAPTMAAIMGLKAPPEWTGRPLKEIFK